MTNSKYERFGKYLILDHLVDGGMAKICRASYLGEQANKIVAIKMVQAQYSKNPSYVQMFEDELNVTFGLLHPNIAQVYDYGMVDEQLYSAMEYVDGGNLKQFLDRLKEKKFVFPVEISTFIISQVSQALHYAHTYQDKLTGKPFNIIHRDISPHNIMLTYDGSVKLIDFGIAKADSNSEATQAGTIKGKLSYLAPEYLEGLELDHRYDQFAVGITLWEMLCSRKLFTAKNDLAVLKQIQACKVPKPSSINPNVPPELDEIVLKSLSKDRNNRFENMDKLNRALVRFLYSNYPEFNNTDLSYFANELFKEEIAADKKKFVEFGKIDLKPYIEDLNRSDNGEARVSETYSDGSFISEEQRTGKIELDLGNFEKNKNQIEPLDLELSNKTSSGIKHKNKAISSTRKIKRTTTASAPGATRTTRPAASGNRTRANTRIKTRVSNKNTKVVEEKKSFVPYLLVGSLLLFALLNPAYVGGLIGVDLVSLLNGSKEEAEKVVEVEKNGVITFNNLDADMEVKVNGVAVSLEGIDYRVELNKSYKISIHKTGYTAWNNPNEIVLSDSRKRKSIYIPSLKKESIGYLTTSRNFSPGSSIKFEVNGKIIQKTLPLKNERVPAGKYEAIITNPVLDTERKIFFEVEENKKNLLED